MNTTHTDRQIKNILDALESARCSLYGLRIEDEDKASVGATLGNSRCWCDECNGETEHQGTSAVALTQNAYTGAWRITEALRCVASYAEAGRVLVLIGSQYYGETGCHYDADECILRDPVVLAIIGCGR